MADKLVETDEEVEKAMIPGGSRAGLKRLRLGYDALVARSDAGNSKLGDGRRAGRINAAGAYLASRKRGRKRVVDAGGSKVKGPRRSGVYKSTDAPSVLEALDSAIEKARGLMPGKLGRGILARRVGRAAGKIIERLDSGNMRLGDGRRHERLTRIQARLKRK
jgi:hypothetical protein